MQTFSPRKAIVFEHASFPLVEVCFRDRHDDVDWTWMLQQFEDLLGGAQRYALLLDSSALTRPPSTRARQQIAEWQKARALLSARWCLGTSIYISSDLIRGALTAMNWLASQVVPIHYPRSRAEGLDWCVTRLDGACLVVPSGLRRRQLELHGASSNAAPAGD